MRIEKLEIENFRGFKGKRTLEFKENLNVFVGVNGAGKTSLLDLISIFLNRYIVRFPSFNGHLKNDLSKYDIHLDAELTKSNIKVIKTNDPNTEDISLQWMLMETLDKSYAYDQALEKFAKEQVAAIKNQPKANIPVFKYFYAQRNTAENKQEKAPKRYLSEQFKAWEGAFEKTSGFEEFTSWFVEEENKENREKVSLKNLDHTNPRLDGIRNALKIFLGNFTAYKYENLRVEDRPFNLVTNVKSSLVINKNGKPFNLNQLSDGEKSLILTVADIAHRLAIANPGLENCLQGNGIVLIDEIDLHLHPAWQREVIPCLTKTFPNIQFFATSHSPQVLSSVPAENIFIIEDFEFVQYTPNTLGKDSNSILWDIFGVTERPKASREKIEDFYTFIK